MMRLKLSYEHVGKIQKWLELRSVVALISVSSPQVQERKKSFSNDVTRIVSHNSLYAFFCLPILKNSTINSNENFNSPARIKRTKKEPDIHNAIVLTKFIVLI